MFQLITILYLWLCDTDFDKVAKNKKDPLTKRNTMT